MGEVVMGLHPSMYKTIESVCKATYKHKSHEEIIEEINRTTSEINKLEVRLQTLVELAEASNWRITE